MTAHSPHPKHFQRVVSVEASPFEARSVFNVLSMIIQQPARDLVAVFNGNEWNAVSRYVGRLASELHVPPPKPRRH